MVTKKIQQLKAKPVKKTQRLSKLKGGLVSQDSDDNGIDLIKESDDDIKDNTTDEETEDYKDEVSENTLNEEDDDADKLDGNRDIDDEDASEEDIGDDDDDEEIEDNDKCAYKSIIKKKKDDFSDSELFEEDIGEKDTFKYKIKKFYIDKDEYISKNILTKYERVRVLAVRTANLSAGAKPMVKNIKTLTYREIARMELKNKKMPFIIERQFSDGSTEVWDVNELEVIN
jgi:DNA-directed RNA polymerase subunit K/omega